METLIGISIFCVFYTYIGYPLILMAWNLVFSPKNKAAIEDKNGKAVSIIIPAYNEKNILQEKIANTQQCLEGFSTAEVIVITDGSTDGSQHLQKNFSTVQFMHRPERKGKAAAINRAVKNAKGDILVFTDANTMLNKNAISNLSQTFDKSKVGAVSGIKKVLAINKKGADTESLYWQYESLIKKHESRFYSLSGAAGELIAIKKAYFKPIWEKAILDDFILSWTVIKQKKQVKVCATAVATENSSLSIKDEFERKKRIAAGGFQSLQKLIWAFNFIKYPHAFFMFFSHRICRWILSPVALMLIFSLSHYALLMQWHFLPLWLTWFIYFEATFLAVGFCGFLLRNKSVKIIGFYLPFYFLLANVAEVAGFFSLITGKQSALWKKAKRVALG